MSKLVTVEETEELRKIAEETRKHMEQMNFQVVNSVKATLEDEYTQKVEEHDEIVRQKQQKFKKEKKASLIGAGVFFGVCVLTPPFGWAVGAGAVTGLACGHLINKTLDAVEKRKTKMKNNFSSKPNLSSYMYGVALKHENGKQ
jgi:uncharacterized membrane protein